MAKAATAARMRRRERKNITSGVGAVKSGDRIEGGVDGLDTLVTTLA